MSSSIRRVLAICGVGVAVAACTDLTTDGANSVALSQAFETIPAGFSANSNSFDPIADDGLPFFPVGMDRTFGFDDRSSTSGRREGDDDDDDHHDGFGKRIRGLLMGGGLGPHFVGAILFFKGRGDGPFHVFDLPDSCTFSSTTERVTCPDRVTDRGFTIKKSFAFEDEAGTAQPKFDPTTTNLVNAQIDVSGTKVRDEDDDDDKEEVEDDDDDDRVTATVHHFSDFTVEGLKPGKTERKVDGTSKAHEEVSGTRHDVKFTAVRDANDTTSGVVIPLKDGFPTIPSAGKVIRNMTVTITKEGGEPKTKTRREEITFDGTNVLSVKITQNGVTKNCTLTLGLRKKLVCE